MLDYLTSFDVFGHQIGVKYKGDVAFKTRLGAFLTLAFYILAFINFKVLIL
jgi:hypothetical protein